MTTKMMEVEIEFVGVSLGDEKMNQLMQMLGVSKSVTVVETTKTPTAPEKPPEVKTCVTCGTSNTPRWRKHPETKEQVCNACAIRARREIKKEATRMKVVEKSEKLSDRLNLIDKEVLALARERISTLSDFLDAEPDVLVRALDSNRTQVASMKRAARMAIETDEKEAKAAGKKPVEIVKKKKWEHEHFSDEHWFTAMWGRIRRIVKGEVQTILRTDEVVRLFRDDMLVDYNLTKTQVKLIDKVGYDMADKSLKAIHDILGPTQSACTSGDEGTQLLVFFPENLPKGPDIWKKIRG